MNASLLFTDKSREIPNTQYPAQRLYQCVFHVESYCVLQRSSAGIEMKYRHFHAAGGTRLKAHLGDLGRPGWKLGFFSALVQRQKFVLLIFCMKLRDHIKGKTSKNTLLLFFRFLLPFF